MTRTLITCANRTWQALGLFALVVSLLGLIVGLIEGWGVGNGVWWAFTTATTTGYGDLSPATVLGRLLGVLTMFVGIIGIGVIVGRIAASVIETRDAWKHEEQEEVKQRLRNIDAQLQALVELDMERSRATTHIYNQPDVGKSLTETLRAQATALAGLSRGSKPSRVTVRGGSSTAGRPSRGSDARHDDLDSGIDRSAPYVYGGPIGVGTDWSDGTSTTTSGGADCSPATPAHASHVHGPVYDSGSSSSSSSSSYDSGSSYSSSDSGSSSSDSGGSSSCD